MLLSFHFTPDRYDPIRARRAGDDDARCTVRSSGGQQPSMTSPADGAEDGSAGQQQLAEGLAGMRSRNMDAKLAAVQLLSELASASTSSPAGVGLPMAAKDRTALMKLAHDAAFRKRDEAARVLSSALLAGLISDDRAENDAASALLRRHAYSLGFGGRSTDSGEFMMMVPVLVQQLNCADSTPLGKREAAGSLMNLAWKSAKLAEAMTSHQALPALVKRLADDASDTAELENAAGALLNILSHGDSAAAVQAAAAGLVSTVTDRLLSVGKNKWSRFGAKLLGLAAAPAAARAQVAEDVIASSAVPHLCTLASPACKNSETQCCALRTLGALGDCGSAALSASIT